VVRLVPILYTDMSIYTDERGPKCGQVISYLEDDRAIRSLSFNGISHVDEKVSQDTRRMESLILSIAEESNDIICVPKAVQHLPTIVIGGSTTTESYVRSACFENVESVLSTEHCTENPVLKTNAANNDTYTISCGIRQVNVSSSSKYDTLNTLQVAVAHMETIKTAYERGYEEVLILESDADMALVPHWGNSGLDAALERIPSDYNVLRLYEWNRNPSEMNSDPSPHPFSIDELHRTPVGLQPVWGAVAYMVSRSGMRYLLDRWNVTDSGMDFINNDVDGVCKKWMFTSECLLFMGPGVYQTSRSLFGHQISAETRRGSERKDYDKGTLWANEASSIDILSSYDLVSTVPTWQRNIINPLSTLPTPTGICCDWPNDMSACGLAETGESMCVVPASPWCSLNKDNCASCSTIWCNNPPIIAPVPSFTSHVRMSSKAILQARLVGPNVTHVSRLEEVVVEANPSQLFVLWHMLEQGEETSKLAHHFGIEKNDLLQGPNHDGVNDLFWKGTHLLIINILECNQSLLPFKPSNLKVLLTKQATTGDVSVYPYEDQQCQWTVVAGDSNLRQVTTQLTAGIERTALREGEYSDTTCEDRWADNEWVMANDNGCHIITNQFVRSQTGISQQLANLEDSTYCGTQLSDPLGAQEQRPKLPNLIWFAHGLWGLPNSGKSVPRMTCNDRFADVIAKLQKMQESDETQVVWQTNYLIEKHPTITNEYLEWEIQCQREVAQENNIPIFDVARLLEDSIWTTSEHDGYHIHSVMLYEIQNVLGQTITQFANHTPSELHLVLSKVVQDIKAKVAEFV